jgi:hypothetical protein
MTFYLINIFFNHFKHCQEAQPEEPERRSTKKKVKLQEDVEKEGGDSQSEDTESDQETTDVGDETYTSKKVNLYRVYIILFSFFVFFLRLHITNLNERSLFFTSLQSEAVEAVRGRKRKIGRPRKPRKPSPLKQITVHDY